MRNIKLTIEYDGTDYAGWQIQNRSKSRKKTIQKTLENALNQILQERIKVIASGRTDAGVHALAQVANFKTKSKLSGKNIQNALNSILPRDIRIKHVEDTHPNFHARFAAKSKLYRYTILNDSFASPFLRRYCYLVKYPLNIKKMRQAAQYLLGRHDLRSFQAVDKRERDSVRSIKRLEIRKTKDIIYLEIEADGFLYHMVRNIAGTMIEVGRGKINPLQIKEILKAKNRVYAGPCAAAKGLCLVRVRYKI